MSSFTPQGDTHTFANPLLDKKTESYGAADTARPPTIKHPRVSDDNSKNKIVPEKKEDVTTFSAMTANLVLSGLGTGILNIPICMASAGIVGAVVIICFGLFVTYISCMIFVYVGDRTGIYDNLDICGKLPGRLGPLMRRVSQFGLWGSYILSLSSYLVAFAKFLIPVLKHLEWFIILTDPSTEGQPNIEGQDPPEMITKQANQKGNAITEGRLEMILKIVCALITLPMCFLSQQKLATFSNISILINIMALVIVVYNFFFTNEQTHAIYGHKLPEEDFNHKAQKAKIESHDTAQFYSENICLFNLSVGGNFGVYSIVLMAVSIQASMLPMYKTLENRTVERFGKSLGISFFFLAIIFSAFAIFAYLIYGGGVMETVTTSFDMSKPQNLIISFGMAMVMLAVYPVVLIPLTALFDDEAAEEGGENEDSVDTIDNENKSGQQRVSQVSRGLESAKRRGSITSVGSPKPVLEANSKFNKPKTPKNLAAKTMATVGIVGATLLLSLVCHSLSVVNIVNGVFSGVLFVAILPPVLGYYLLYKNISTNDNPDSSNNLTSGAGVSNPNISRNKKSNASGRYKYAYHPTIYMLLSVVAIVGAIFGGIYTDPDTQVKQKIYKSVCKNSAGQGIECDAAKNNIFEKKVKLIDGICEWRYGKSSKDADKENKGEK